MTYQLQILSLSGQWENMLTPPRKTEAEAWAQVGSGHGTATHALDGSHLKLVEDFHLSPEHGEGFVVEVDLAIGPFPELIPDSESCIDSLDYRVRDIGHNAFVLCP